MDNSLNFIRYIAALSVLIGHSFTLYGYKTISIFSIHLGRLSVFIFFIISGYLIAKSWDKTPNLLIFLKKRVLRIFPALVICIFFTVIFLGAAVTVLPLKDYFSSLQTYRYFLNDILYIIYTLPGVFKNLPYPNIVNGSLWSLPVEFFMYLYVAFIGFVFSAKRVLYAISLFIFIILFFYTTKDIVIYNVNLKAIYLFGIFFIMGAIIYKYGLEKYLTFKNAIFSVIILIAAYLLNLNILYFMWFVLPIIVLTFGLKKGSFITTKFQKNDYSYGLYIYAFPIQQTILYFFPKINFTLYTLSSILITHIFAVLSWHIIEKKALSLKNIKII